MATADGTRLHLRIAIDYSARDAMVAAAGRVVMLIVAFEIGAGSKLISNSTGFVPLDSHEGRELPVLERLQGLTGQG